jgi:hypothetical protein
VQALRIGAPRGQRQRRHGDGESDEFPGQIAEARGQTAAQHQQADDGVRSHAFAPLAVQPRRRREPDARIPPQLHREHGARRRQRLRGQRRDHRQRQ